MSLSNHAAAQARVQVYASGSGSKNIVFLHGLMGRGKNFSAFAKKLDADCHVLLVDLPNHGESSWTSSVDYCDLARQVGEAVHHELNGAPYNLVGHSMGGKVAMTMALSNPQNIAKLMVVDISPTQSWSGKGEFPLLLDSLRAVDLKTVSVRSEVDMQLKKSIPDDRVRGFLMQNLRYRDGQFYWQANIELLYRSLESIGSFPDFETVYERPVLWVAGSESRYIQDKHGPVMRALFPKVQKVTVKGAGHWVHSQKPEEFTQLLRYFLG